jgi:hypothetical protein
MSKLVNKIIYSVLRMSVVFTGSAIVGCGGGGGSSSVLGSDVAGFYSGQMYEVKNTCRAIINAPDVVAPTWKVNQDGARIVLDAASGATFEGNTTGAGAFQARKLERSSGNCVTTSLIDVSDVTDDSGDAAFEVQTECPIGVCIVGYAGRLERRR